MTRRFTLLTLMAICLPALAVLALGACGTRQATTAGTVAKYTEADNFTSVSAAVGDKFQLSLNESPDKGETWQLKPSAGLKVVSSTYNTTLGGMDKSASVGARTWTIAVTAAGTQKVEGFYGAHKKSGAQIANYSLTVEVK